MHSGLIYTFEILPSLIINQKRSQGCVVWGLVSCSLNQTEGG